MQLNRNSSRKPGTNFSGLFLTYYYMLVKMALILVLEEKERYFLFPVVKYLEVVRVHFWRGTDSQKFCLLLI